MDCLQIDWKNIDHTFVRDEFYENIQAPKWVDFTAPFQPADDYEWFCARAGCTHDHKPFTEISFTDYSISASNALAPLNEKTNSRRSKAVISSSISSLSDIREAFAKSRSMYQPPLSSLQENNYKAEAGKKSGRRQQPSENDNPNQAFRAYDRQQNLKPFGGVPKKMKMSENKEAFSVKESSKIHGHRKESSSNRIFKPAVASSSEKNKGLFSSSSEMKATQIRSLGDACKSTHSVDVKEEKSKDSKEQVFCIGEPKLNKPSVQRAPFSVYTSFRPGLKDSYITSSMPVKKPVTVARSMYAISLGNDKSLPVKPPRIIARKEHRAPGVSNDIASPSCQKKKNVSNLMERKAVLLKCNNRNLATNCKTEPVVNEPGAVESPSEKKEDLVQTTLENFLKKLSLVNDDKCQNGENVIPNDLKEHKAESDFTLTDDKHISCSEPNSKPDQWPKDLRRSNGKKRKSSELNFKVNCSSKDHKHDDHKACGVESNALMSPSKQCKTKSKVPLKSTQPPVHDSCKEQHKKMKTTNVQPFKPFRLRTEERVALREQGLAKKEQEVSVSQKNQESSHNVLKVPTFGQPFKPQRSTKKLTVPREPNFHTSRTRRACTRHGASVPTA